MTRRPEQLSVAEFVTLTNMVEAEMQAIAPATTHAEG